MGRGVRARARAHDGATRAEADEREPRDSARGRRGKRGLVKRGPSGAVPVIATTGDDLHRGTERKPSTTRAAATASASSAVAVAVAVAQAWLAAPRRSFPRALFYARRRPRTGESPDVRCRPRIDARSAAPWTRRSIRSLYSARS